MCALQITLQVQNVIIICLGEINDYSCSVLLLLRTHFILRSKSVKIVTEKKFCIKNSIQRALLYILQISPLLLIWIRMCLWCYAFLTRYITLGNFLISLPYDNIKHNKTEGCVVTDYISLELTKGNPRLLIDFGSGTLELLVKTRKGLNDGEWHRLDILWEKQVSYIHSPLPQLQCLALVIYTLYNLYLTIVYDYWILSNYSPK